MTTPRNILVFMGTRPEAVKLAPVVAALRDATDFRCTVVATGQHKEMFRQVAETFGFTVDVDLDVMRPNQTLAGLTARLMDGIDGWLGSAQPDMALVQGDTTTVLVAALACFYRRIPIGHVEAGLRTGNIWSPFPEEANRKLATPLVALHFAPTEAARTSLLREGVAENTISVTGNTVIDALRIEVARQVADVTIRAGQAIRSVVLGVVVTALLQSAIGGLGLAISGIPAAPLLAAVMLFLCLAQLGPVPVLLPAVIYLYWSGQSGYGTLLLVVAISTMAIDNVVRPLLIRRGASLPILLILTGVIGGLITFGIIGLFIGPAVLTVAYTLLTKWVATEEGARAEEMAVGV